MRWFAWMAVLLMGLAFAGQAVAQDYDLTKGIWRRTDGAEVRFTPSGDGYETVIVTLQPGTGHLFRVGESLGKVGRPTGKTFAGTGTFRGGNGETRPEYTATFESINVFTTTFGERYTRIPPLPEAAADGGNQLELEGTWKRVVDGHVVAFSRNGEGYVGTIVEPAGVGHLFKAGEKTFGMKRTSSDTFDGKIMFRSGGAPGVDDWRDDRIVMKDANNFTDIGGAWVRVGAQAGAGNQLDLEGTWRRSSDGYIVKITRNGDTYVAATVDAGGLGGVFKPGENTMEVKRTSGDTFEGRMSYRWSDGRQEWRNEKIVMQDGNRFTHNLDVWVRTNPAPARGCDRTFAKVWDPGTWGRMVITVEGNRASGTYASRYQRLSGGTFSGTLTGNQLQADWRDNDGEGTFTLTLTDDGCTFTGKHTVTRGVGAGAAGSAGAQDPGGRDIGMANAGGLVNGLPGEPCSDPETQKCIQKWMDMMIEIRNRRDTSPQGQGGPWRFSEYGTLLGHSVIAAYAPDGWETKYKRNKYCVVWEIWQRAHLDPLHGNELPALGDYVRSCYAMNAKPVAGGTGTSAGGTGTGDTASSGSTGRPPEVSAMTVYAESRRVPTGERVNLPVWLLRGSDVANINLVITYDPAVVRIDSEPGKGNLLADALFSANSGETGVVRVGFAQRAGINGNGTLATLPFKTVGQTGARSPITIQVSSINNAAGATPRVDVLSGEILIVGPDGMLPGDSDGDGRVTELDALLALKMSVKLLDPSLTLDLDADRQVTSRDSVLILQRAVQSR